MILVRARMPKAQWLWILITFYVVTFVDSKKDSTIVYNVVEESHPGRFVGQVSLNSDINKKYNDTIKGLLRYKFLNSDDLGVGYFRIDPVTSVITTSEETLDRDTLCDVVSTCCQTSETCYIKLFVAVHPNEYFQLISVRIEVEDINDNNPEFSEERINVKIAESSAVNSTYLIPSAFDLDTGINGVQKYMIQSTSDAFGLKLLGDPNDFSELAVMNLKRLDREEKAYYQIKVIAQDGGTPPKTGTCIVDITVTDSNDNKPKFRNATYSVKVKENVKRNTSIIRLVADDPDLDKNGEVRYYINKRASEQIKQLFAIDPRTGILRVIGRLNYEGIRTYRIPIDARDMGPNAIPERTTVTVHVLDVNDNSPQISVNLLTSSGTAEVSEAANIGTFVAHILVEDVDSGENSQVSCTIDNYKFGLIKNEPSDQLDYRLVTASKLNRESQTEHQVTIVCHDNGIPRLESRESFTVRVLDANDNTPKFNKESYTCSVKENNPKGKFLIQVAATDKDMDKAGEVRYNISGNSSVLVTINEEDGRIYANERFDRESYDQVTFEVIAYDRGLSPLTATTVVTVKIEDENDNAPYFLEEYNRINVSESIAAHTSIGRVKAKDDDTGLNAKIIYSIIVNEAAEAFDVSSKGVITTRRLLDREHTPLYKIDVVAKDKGDPALSTTSKVIVLVTDINDNPPEFQFPNPANNTVYISYLEGVDHVVTQVNATDSDSGQNAQLVYRIVDGNEDGLFRMDPSNGVIIIAKEMTINDAFVHRLTIQVSDKGERSNTDIATLNIAVDGTGKAISISGAYLNPTHSNKNLIIVICLAAVSGFLAIILIIAIVCIRRKDINNHNYNIKTETQRIFEKRKKENNLRDQKMPPKKEVSFSLEADEILDSQCSVPMNNHSTFLSGKTQQSWDSSIAPKSFEPPRACSSLIQAGTPENQYRYDKHPTNNLSGRTAPFVKSGKELTRDNIPKHKELTDLLKPNCDTDSDHSGHHSSDSGRGGSEEELDDRYSTTLSRGISSPGISPLGLKNPQNILSSPTQDCSCTDNSKVVVTPSSVYGHNYKKVTNTPQLDYTCSDVDVVLSSKPSFDNMSLTSENYTVDPEQLCQEIDNLFFNDVIV